MSQYIYLSLSIATYFLTICSSLIECVLLYVVDHLTTAYCKEIVTEKNEYQQKLML